MKRNSKEISTEVGNCTINTEVSEIISWSFEYIKKTNHGVIYVKIFYKTGYLVPYSKANKWSS